jgi:hypothetical protein
MKIKINFLSALFSVIIVVAAIVIVLTYWSGVKTTPLQVIFYGAILVVVIILFVFRPKDNLDHKLIYFSIALAVFAIITPALSQKDSEIKQIGAANEYNCLLSSQRISQILWEFSSTQEDYYSKSYIIDPYISNLEDLIGQVSSTNNSSTFQLIEDLQNQNGLIENREAVMANSYQSLEGTNFLKDSQVEEQEIDGYDYFFLTKAEEVIQDTKSLQGRLFGEDIPDCNAPSIPAKLCANMGSFGSECWGM